MKKFILIIFLGSLFLTSCNGQNNEGDIKNISRTEPETKVIVKKEYDKNGNIVKYDSIYSYYYSNIANDSLLEDSIFDNFKSFFNQEYSFSTAPFFNDMFFQDSLLKYDFYNKNFFYNRFINNPRSVEDLFIEMDSLKNQFFKQQFPQSNKVENKK